MVLAVLGWVYAVGMLLQLRAAMYLQRVKKQTHEPLTVLIVCLAWPYFYPCAIRGWWKLQTMFLEFDNMLYAMAEVKGKAIERQRKKLGTRLVSLFYRPKSVEYYKADFIKSQGESC